MKSVREVFTSEARWTQRAFARDENGERTSCTSATACCWCLAGAIIHVYGELAYTAFDRIHWRGGIAESDLCNWNDAPERTFQDVVDLCIKAGV